MVGVIRWGIGVDDVEGVDLSAMGDDVVLQGGVAAVGLAEGAARLHLVDVQRAVGTTMYDIGQYQNIVILESGFEEVDGTVIV